MMTSELAGVSCCRKVERITTYQLSKKKNTDPSPNPKSSSPTPSTPRKKNTTQLPSEWRESAAAEKGKS
jgi:hypothetical protein